MIVGFGISDWHAMRFSDAAAVSVGGEIVLELSSAEGIRSGQYAEILGGTNEGVYLIVEVVDGTYLRVNGTLVLEDPVVVCVQDLPNVELTTTYGSSMTLQEVADSIDAETGVNAELDADQRILLGSDIVGVEDQVASTLEVLSQPQLTINGIPVDALGMPEYAAGACTALRFLTEDLRRYPILRGYSLVSDELTGSVRRVLDSSVLELEDRFSADLGQVIARIYARGARSYEQAVEAFSAEYQASVDKLISDTSRLRDLLGQSIVSPKARSEARAYIRSSIGSSSGEEGPAYELLSILRGYFAPVSDPLDSGFRMLRERGFDLCVDLLLLGDVAAAMSSGGASYSLLMQDSATSAGLEGF